MDPRTDRLRLVPNALSVVRLLLAVPAFLLITEYFETGNGLPALLAVMAAVVTTDQLDGRIARRLGCCTDLGARLDVAADVAFAVSGILALAVNGSTPYILLAAMGLLFIAFAFSSRAAGRGKVVYDPVGRTAGILCMTFPYVAVASAWFGFPDGFVFWSGCILSALVFIAFEVRAASILLGGRVPASG
ncbi:MAG: CDP-alcohol phosphatidyltransferase family protein [Thermoplasmata archaeon]|nr:CDP-alcohol phosphatidyltransferase family protein [Thermoplasmata archaeon]